MLVGERLYKVLKKLHITQAKLANQLGISSVVLNRYFKDKTNPSSEFLGKLALNYNININWLLNGEGKMFYSGDEDMMTLNGDNFYNLPIIAAVSCGSPQEIEGAESLDSVLVNEKDLPGSVDEYFAFFAQGDSMHPYISNGDVVVVRQNDNWYQGHERTCVVNVDGEVTLKKVSVSHNGAKVFLLPYNTKYEVLELNEERLASSKMVGIALMAVRNL